MDSSNNNTLTDHADTGLLQFLLDQSSLFALLDNNGAVLWIRDESFASTGQQFADIYALTAEGNTFNSGIDDKKFIIGDIPGSSDKFVKVLRNTENNNEFRNLAHDFNNILSGLLNQLDTLKEKFTDDPATFKALDIMENNSIRATEIIENALNKTSRKNALKQKIKPALLFDEVLSTVGVKKHGNITVIKEIYSDASVNINRANFFRVLLNLVTNAVEAIKHTEGELRFVTHSLDEKYLTIELHDNGCGITPENLSKVFENGFSTKKSNIDRGIGLAVTKSLVEADGGRIHVSSTLGEGSIFSLTYPVNFREKTTAVNGKNTILIADDETEMRELLADLFTESGYNVVHTGNGDDALNMFMENGDINIIILDKKMPGMDGVRCVEKIREIDEEIPVILASGSLRETEKQLLRFYNLNHLLEKPYKFDELLKITTELVNG